MITIYEDEYNELKTTLHKHKESDLDEEIEFGGRIYLKLELVSIFEYLDSKFV